MNGQDTYNCQFMLDFYRYGEGECPNSFFFLDETLCYCSLCYYFKNYLILFISLFKKISRPKPHFKHGHYPVSDIFLINCVNG